MKTTKLSANSFEQVESTAFDAEALQCWGEQAQIQLSYMDAIAAYLD